MTGLILAGGEGRRMGGADKGLQLLAGRPLVAHVLERLAPQVGTVLISANRHGAEYGRLGWPVIADDPGHLHAGQLGPLAGMYAGLSRCSTEWLLCVPCDTPALPADLCAQLAAGLRGARMAVAACAGHPQPAVCLMHTSLRQSLADFLGAGKRQVRAWQESAGTMSVSFANALAFANLNTLQDLAGYTAPTADKEP